MNKDSKIYVAGHRGMVGSAILRLLKKEGYNNIIIQEVNLINQDEVNSFFEKNKPEYVFLVAGKVGGIKANNTYRADFIYNNLMIAANVIHAAYLFEVDKLLYTGSSCVYPKLAQQPIPESELLNGRLEQTNEPYAIAKIAGIKMCEAYRSQYGCNFISAMPTNCYGENDNYNLEDCHVLPALLLKTLNAIKNGTDVNVWGTGSAKREFIYVDDLANALIFLMNNYNESETINVGTGEEYSIKQLCELIKYLTGFKGEFIFGGNLDGTPRKILNSLKLYNLGWKPSVTISEGIKKTIQLISSENTLVYSSLPSRS